MQAVLVKKPEIEDIEEYIDGTEPIKVYYSALLDTGEPFKIEVWLEHYIHFKEVVFFEDGPLKGLPDYKRSPVDRHTIEIEVCYVNLDSGKAWVCDRWEVAEGKTYEEAVENFKKWWNEVDLKKYLREYLNAPKRLFDNLEDAKRYGEARRAYNGFISEMEAIFEEDLDYLRFGEW